MRAALAAVALVLTGCADPPPAVVAPLPAAPPADVERACADPGVAEDLLHALAETRAALASCRGAAEINADAWRRHRGE